MLAWRLRVRPQEAVLLTLRTAQDTAHIINSFLFPCLDLQIHKSSLVNG